MRRPRRLHTLTCPALPAQKEKPCSPTRLLWMVPHADTYPLLRAGSGVIRPQPRAARGAAGGTGAWGVCTLHPLAVPARPFQPGKPFQPGPGNARGSEPALQATRSRRGSPPGQPRAPCVPPEPLRHGAAGPAPRALLPASRARPSRSRPRPRAGAQCPEREADAGPGPFLQKSFIYRSRQVQSVRHGPGAAEHKALSLEPVAKALPGPRPGEGPSSGARDPAGSGAERSGARPTRASAGTDGRRRSCSLAGFPKLMSHRFRLVPSAKWARFFLRSS